MVCSGVIGLLHSHKYPHIIFPQMSVHRDNDEYVQGKWILDNKLSVFELSKYWTLAHAAFKGKKYEDKQWLPMWRDLRRFEEIWGNIWKFTNATNVTMPLFGHGI